MSSPKTGRVVVTHDFPEAAITAFPADIVVDWHRSVENLNPAELATRAHGADALCCYSDRLDAKLLEELDTVSVVACHWGPRHVDLAAASREGILVLAPQSQYDWIVSGVAELVVGLMIAAGRRLLEADRFTRDGRMNNSEASNVHLLGHGLRGRTVGLIGGGRIGSAVGELCHALGMTILYSDPEPSPSLDGLGARRVAMTDLLRTADYVSVSVPPDEANRRLIGAAEFAAMKPSAVFVNTARGMSVDEAALAAALATGEIFAAGVDVYENEPDVNQELTKLSNVILMPHAGGALYEERLRAARFMVDNVIRALRGQRPEGLLNEDLWPPDGHRRLRPTQEVAQ